MEERVQISTQMKIAVIGFSGSGKSTLCRKLGEKYQLPILHLDKVEHLPRWQIRELPEKLQMVKTFMEENSSWVIDGNYGKLFYWERMEQADKIIMMRFNRFDALCRVVRRYWSNRGNHRPDMAQGCSEKLDFKFIKRVLIDGRKKEFRDRHEKVLALHPQKVIQLRTQQEIDTFWEEEEQLRHFPSLQQKNHD
jgi:adenylate kinase family enzyme